MEILKLAPVLKDYLWGGTRLKEEFQMETDLTKVAEAWTLACHKDGQSVIENGSYAGKTLAEVLSPQWLGTHGQAFPYFPVLIKLIDAKDNLSIQVHPDNDYAQRVEGEFGKTEMWYVADCEEGASLVYGFQKEISREEFEKAIQENTLPDVLNTVKVKKGDLFFIEAGTVHAIGKGTLIAEIQQNSNSTYRVYDYGRVGADGKPRELHVKKALDVTRTVPPARDNRPQGEPVQEPGCTRTLLADCPLFKVVRAAVQGCAELSASEESFSNLLILEGTGTLTAGAQQFSLKKGDSFFIPAGFGSFAVEGNLTLLETKV